MKKDDFIELLNSNAAAVAHLLGVTPAAVYVWRKNGVPPYWCGAVQNLTDEQVKNVVEKINNKKIANAQKRSKRND